MNLPESVLDKAVSSGSGELAWQLSDVGNAAMALRHAGKAIVGWEAWLVGDFPGGWTGLIPSKDGGPPGVWAGETSPREQSEAWQDYCDRTAGAAVAAIAGMAIESQSDERIIDDLWINLSFVSEDD